MISVIIRPKLQSFRNRWRRQSLTRRRIHDLIIAMFALLVGISIYLGTLWSWTKVLELPFLAFIPPALPLSLLLMMVVFMTLMSAVASSLGIMYFADDIELLLSAPVRNLHFFLGRSSIVYISVVWMPFIFTFPILLAFGHLYSASLPVLAHALLSLIPFFIIPVMFAVVIASLATTCIDPRWNKLMLLVGALLVLVGMVFVAHTLGLALRMRNDPNQLLSFVAKIERANVAWNPSAWVATILSEALVPTGKRITTRYLALYSAAVCSVTLAYISLLLLHSHGYTRARNAATGYRRVSPRPTSFTIVPSHPWIALLQKELRSVLRDIAQTTQLFFLVGMCFLYILHIGGFVSIESFPQETRRQWQIILLMMHTAATAFFITSVCTRFVFSSISAEGKSFWLLQTAPLPIKDIFHAKLVTWFPPIAVISTLLLGIGATVISQSYTTSMILLVIGLFLSFAIVASAVGFGGFFADFSWEHPSQIATSLTNFTFMASCMVLIGLHIPCVGYIALLLLRLRMAPNPSLWLIIVALVLVIGAFDVLIGLWALRKGEQGLSKAEVI